MIASGSGFHVNALVLYPLSFAALVVFTTALTFWVSAMNVRYRDVQHLIGLALLVWFWMTPIVYPAGTVQAKLTDPSAAWSPHLWQVYLLNPLTPIISGFQRALYGTVSYIPSGQTASTPVLPDVSVAWLAVHDRHGPRRLVGVPALHMEALLPSLRRLRGGAVTAALEVEDLSKVFRLFRERPSSLKQRLLTGRMRAEDFWALRDIAFDVQEGASLGLIGHNGSGKTTLLKCIAGIIRPTSGVIRYRGRVAALLELGAGFHPELTGRENVYLNASFLGLSRRDTDRVYDDIVSFAELQDFMDNQVKFFSSGMLVRLGFAVAVHVEPDILLIDEVLAVGDEAFQAKCLDRVRSFQAEGRTIVLVTHALDTVREVCDRAVMLDHGRIHAIGLPDDVVREMRYVLLGGTDPGFVAEQGTREAEIAAVEIIRASGAGDGPVLRDDPLTIQIDVRTNEPVDDLDVDFAVLDGATNHPVIKERTSTHGIVIDRFDGKKRVRFRVPSFPYTAGKYWVTIGLSSRSTGHLFHVQTQRYLFEVIEVPRVQEHIEVVVEAEVEDL